LNDPTNQAVFGPQGENAADYVVKATVLVSFTDVKRAANDRPNQSVQIVAPVTVVPQQLQPTHDEQSFSSASSIGAVFLLLFVCILVSL
jgi:hypothetical protein